MTKKSIILTTILLVILAISIGIAFNLAKIKELTASHLDNLNTTSRTLVKDQNQLAQLESRNLDLKVKTKGLLSLSGNLREL